MVPLRSLTPTVVVCSLAAVMLCCSLTSAQFGPEMYGLVGRFGMGSPIPSRVLAMGGQVSCVNDVQFANPAFAAVQTGSDVGGRWSFTNFQNGPDATCAMGHAMIPLKRDRQGLQITFLDLDTSNGDMTLPIVGPVTTKFYQKAVVLDFGQRLDEHWTAGLSVLGQERIGLDIVSAGGPLLLELKDKAAYGFRGGVSYELAPGDYAGGLLSYSRDEVTTTGLAALPGANFDSWQLALGASRHVTPELLLAAEWQHGVSETTGFKSTADTFHFGAEYRPVPELGVRAGLSDGNLSAGLGYTLGKWRVDYAYINNWNDDDVKALFGGSETHAVHIILWW
jgi:hypothetical protein